MKVTRRDFIATTAVGSASLALDLKAQSKPAPGRHIAEYDAEEAGHHLRRKWL